MKNRPKMKLLHLLFLSLTLSFAASGQTVNEVFKKMNAKFVAPKPFQFDTKYSLYKDHKTAAVHQSYKGVFIKNAANEVYMKIDKTEFINTKSISLKVNHSEKAMLASDKQNFSTGDFDVSKLLNFCKIASFKDYKSYWEIVLTPRELSGLNYSKIVLNIAKNYTLQKQIFYYNVGFNFSKDYRKENIQKPRLEIIYSNYKDKITMPGNLNTSLFFTIAKNNTIIPTSKFKNYEVEDRRTKVTKTNKSAN